MSLSVFPGASQAPLCFCIEQMVLWGYSLEDVLAGSGLQPGTYASPDTVPDSRQEQIVYENIQRIFPGPAGLHLGRQSNTNSIGILGGLLANALDLGHAGYLSRRFHPLSNSRIIPELIGSLVEGQSTVRYRLTGGTPDLYRFLMDRDILGTRQVLRDLFGTSADEYVCKVEFGYPEPEDAELYYEAFNCPVGFGHDATYVTYNDALGCLSNKRRNSYVYHLYLRLCRDALAQRGSLSWQSRVNNILSCIDTYPDAVEMARKLRCSERSLRRHLKDEGAQYSDLIDRVRFERAAYLLKHSSDSIKEISYKLFYSEPPAFVRAFTRWSGSTPSEFRGNPPQKDASKAL